VRKDVARQIRIHRPDAIFTMDPTSRLSGSYVNHPDHIAAAEVVLRSINPDASTRQMFPELWSEERLEPHKPKALFLMVFDEKGTVVDISSVLETKVKALLAHSSQLWPGAEEMVRGWAKSTGKAAGYRAGESFRIVRLDEEPEPAGDKPRRRGRRGIQRAVRTSTRAATKRTPSRRKRAR
jgi:LmbE family N-acetylglucosaminyl deacetylase